MLKDSARLLCLATLSLLLLCFALLGMCRVADAAAPAQTRQEIMVSVPLSKLKELRSLTDRQEQRLNQLQELLDAQSSTLSEQQSSISQLRQELETAKSSLSKSELIISEQNKSLTSLSLALKQEQRRTERIKRQRLLWQIVAGSAAIYAMTK